MAPKLEGKVALVAGGTRGAGRGIAVELGAAGATVYVTGRSTSERRSEYDRPETIEETAALVDEAGGHGIPARVDHLEPDEVQVPGRGCIEGEQGPPRRARQRRVGRGAPDRVGHVPVWEHSLDKGFQDAQARHRHAHHHQPLCPAPPDQERGWASSRDDRRHRRATTPKNYRNSLFYDLAKTSVIRLAWAQARELAPHGCTAVALTPGWLRSEMMLDNFSAWARRTGATPLQGNRTLGSPRRRVT